MKKKPRDPISYVLLDALDEGEEPRVEVFVYAKHALSTREARKFAHQILTMCEKAGRSLALMKARHRKGRRGVSRYPGHARRLRAAEAKFETAKRK